MLKETNKITVIPSYCTTNRFRSMRKKIEEILHKNKENKTLNEIEKIRQELTRQEDMEQYLKGIEAHNVYCGTILESYEGFTSEYIEFLRIKFLSKYNLMHYKDLRTMFFNEIGDFSRFLTDEEFEDVFERKRDK